MTLLQSITSSPTDDFGDRSTLLKELVYYLNIGFTTYGVGNNYGYQTYGDAFRMAPWVTAYDAKGSPYSPLDVGRIDDNPDFPLLMTILLLFLTGFTLEIMVKLVYKLTQTILAF